jgi:hypothetical protein
MIISEYNCIYFEDMVSEYVITLQKPVIFFRIYGWYNSKDTEKINESKEIYRQSLPLDIYTAMSEGEFVFVKIDNVDEAMEFCEDNFPESIDKCEKEFYIQYKVFNTKGQIVGNN